MFQCAYLTFMDDHFSGNSRCRHLESRKTLCFPVYTDLAGFVSTPLLAGKLPSAANSSVLAVQLHRRIVDSVCRIVKNTSCR
jgi:hypothetical protein